MRVKSKIPNKLDIMYSSNRSDWGTPTELLRKLSRVYTFALDAAANEDNTICERWLGPGSALAENCLTVDWGEFVNPGDTIWMNPPYRKGELKHFISKAYNEYVEGVNSIVLVPARTETQWFQLCYNAAVLVFVKGRLVFEGADSGAPFPSCLVVFDHKFNEKKFSWFSAIGNVVKPTPEYRDFLD